MTRINVVPVELLIDVHLLAEYREITRISKLARIPKQWEVFPAEYTLGVGHVKFFYDKGLWLKTRTERLLIECLMRGYGTELKVYKKHPEGLNSDWVPTDKALMENIHRLDERCYNMKRQPTLGGVPVSRDHYNNMLRKGDVA